MCMGRGQHGGPKGRAVDNMHFDKGLGGRCSFCCCFVAHCLLLVACYMHGWVYGQPAACPPVSQCLPLPMAPLPAAAAALARPMHLHWLMHRPEPLLFLLPQIPFMLRAGLLTTLTCGLGLAAR